MRILVIEDERRIAESLKKGLMQEEYTVDLSFSGDTGYDLASTEDYDLIILDRMLPGLDGVEVCQKLRAEHNHTPILLLTAKGQVEDKVSGLDAGADDYLTKPFAFEELLARVRALVRRPHTNAEPTLKLDNLELDPQKFTVTRAGKSIEFSNKEFVLLEYFLRHPNTILSKDHLIQHVWDYDADILPNTVEVYIRKLREKIDRPFAQFPALLHTVRGFGYKIQA